MEGLELIEKDLEKNAVAEKERVKYLILEDGNDRLSRNVGKELPIPAA
jgi:hypothetical protein